MNNSKYSSEELASLNQFVETVSNDYSEGAACHGNWSRHNNYSKS